MYAFTTLTTSIARYTLYIAIMFECRHEDICPYFDARRFIVFIYFFVVKIEINFVHPISNILNPSRWINGPLYNQCVSNMYRKSPSLKIIYERDKEIILKRKCLG